MQEQQVIDRAAPVEEGDAVQEPQGTEPALTIQQMAQATGLSAHTLRYYERAGLMRPQVGRGDSSGHRAYTQQHVSWVGFIKRLRATGMPIRDIQRYTELVQQGEQTFSARLDLLEHHRKQVEANLLEVEQHLAAINKKIARYAQLEAQRQSMDSVCLNP